MQSFYPVSNQMFPFQMQAQPAFQSSLAPPLYIGNLDPTIHEEQLFSHFSKYGPLHSLKIIKDKLTNRSRGFGYINFINPKDAENARMLSQYEKIGKNPIRLMYKRNVREVEGVNIFVKNLDSSVTFKELHNLFARIGNVTTVKIAANPKGESLGYGYVLMEKREDAEAATKQLDGFKLKEKEISCGAFVAKDRRENQSTNTNLYVKGLPAAASKEDIENMIYNEFSKFGKIVSHTAQQSKDERWFAFVCYESPSAAEEALKQLHESNVFGPEPLYVAWHQSKKLRGMELKKAHPQVKNDNTLFVKNLRPEVTKEMLKQAFSQFGEIASTEVRLKQLNSDDVRSFGFISFKVPQDTLRAQADGVKSEEIAKLFLESRGVYINFLQPKEQRDLFKATKLRQAFNPHGLSSGQMPFNARVMPFGFPMVMPGTMRPVNNYQGQMHQVSGGAGPKRGFPGQKQFDERPQPQRGGRNNRAEQKNQFVPEPRNNEAQKHREQPKEVRAVAQQQVPLEINLTAQTLKDKLDEFLKLDAEKQRNILGELLFPKILAKSKPEYAPKITGMLVDFDVLTVQDILEMLEEDQILEERVQEAQELIISEEQN